MHDREILNAAPGATAATGADPARRADGPEITVSVVSHAQELWVAALLRSLAATCGQRRLRVVLTHNLPTAGGSQPAAGWPFELVEIRNRRPLGFGANHNQAFVHCESPLFCVVNPDIVLTQPDPWAPLLQAIAQPGVALAYPALVNDDGSLQDNQRAVPTPAALLRRHLLRRAELRRDWVSAAFWLVRADAYRALGGFDERYHMYCEDTDFCLRLQLRGWHMAAAQVRVRHAAARRSRTDVRHLAWHLRSLARLWASPVLRHYLRARRP